jgi:hypothetical protein
VLTGYNVTGSFNEATWLATGSLTSAMIADAGINGSTAGWGVDNNVFSGTTELMFFDFGAQPLSDPDGAGGIDPNASGASLPNISFATFDFIQYTAADDIKYVVHYTDGTFDSGTIPSANMVAGGPDWTFTADAGKFIADIELLTSGTGPGKVDLVSVGVQTSDIDQTIDFNVTITDADGDPVSGGFSVNVSDGNTPTPPEALVVQQQSATQYSSLSLLTSDSHDQHHQHEQQKVAANSNTVVLAAAVAAAGIVADPVAAHSVAHGHAATAVESALVADSQGSVASSGNEVSHSALGGESREAVSGDSQQASSSANHGGHEPAGGHSLTADNDSAPAAQPTELLSSTNAPASDAHQSVAAPAVAMPSADALIAASLQGKGPEGSEGNHSNAVVGKVLVDALHGGGGEHNIDALLAALPGHGNGANVAADALASQPVAHVPAWDMGHMGALHAHANFTMVAVTLHHDAVQPVHNG